MKCNTPSRFVKFDTLLGTMQSRRMNGDGLASISNTERVPWSWLPSASEEGLRQRIKAQGRKTRRCPDFETCELVIVNDETGTAVPLGCRMPFPFGEKNVDALLALQQSYVQFKVGEYKTMPKPLSCMAIC